MSQPNKNLYWILFSYSSGDQKSRFGFTVLKINCLQGCAFTEGSREEFASLESLTSRPAFRGSWPLPPFQSQQYSAFKPFASDVSPSPPGASTEYTVRWWNSQGEGQSRKNVNTVWKPWLQPAMSVEWSCMVPWWCWWTFIGRFPCVRFKQAFSL